VEKTHIKLKVASVGQQPGKNGMNVAGYAMDKKNVASKTLSTASFDLVDALRLGYEGAARACAIASMAREGDVLELILSGARVEGAALEVWTHGKAQDVLRAGSLEEPPEALAPSPWMPGLGALDVGRWRDEARVCLAPSVEQWSIAMAAVSSAVSSLSRNEAFKSGVPLGQDPEARAVFEGFGKQLSSMDDESVELAAGMLRRCVEDSGGDAGPARWLEVYSAVQGPLLGPARARMHEGLLGQRIAPAERKPRSM
jgi:hypothetical protein